MRKRKCSVCGYIYDETKETSSFEYLPEGWTCPQCGAPKSAFQIIEGEDMAKLGKTNVAEKIVEQLVAYGVKKIFGIPGDSNLPLTEAIRKNTDIDLVLTRHEQAAAFMASAHATADLNCSSLPAISGRLSPPHPAQKERALVNSTGTGASVDPVLWPQSIDWIICTTVRTEQLNKNQIHLDFAEPTVRENAYFSYPIDFCIP